MYLMLEAVEPLLFTKTPKELCGHQTFILEQTENQHVPIRGSVTFHPEFRPNHQLETHLSPHLYLDVYCIRTTVGTFEILSCLY